jgi:phosphohistidine phosphatase
VRVYLLRHATAEECGPRGDASRGLTDQGRREAREAAEALLERHARPAMILTSPRLRARETAEIVGRVLGVSVEVREGLDSGARAAAYLDALQPTEERDALVVGHNPELSAFASSLAGTAVSFRPATICCVEMTGEAATLEWVRHPDPPSPS